ncbi:hypothetical protein [Bifidobacterium felsineum]|uniref:hypothetical protein n=1 Tax=Bifidobacterium felsineum TaxID=2045440 RepID=UPI001BDCB950|nr:hypothetical protein [Bifidobacterium felsineum]MBT1164966.1 hypothetical protein [Bifidobacterium felsineum]
MAEHGLESETVPESPGRGGPAARPASDRARFPLPAGMRLPEPERFARPKPDDSDAVGVVVRPILLVVFVVGWPAGWVVFLVRLAAHGIPSSGVPVLVAGGTGLLLTGLSASFMLVTGPGVMRPVLRGLAAALTGVLLTCGLLTPLGGFDVYGDMRAGPMRATGVVVSARVRNGRVDRTGFDGTTRTDRECVIEYRIRDDGDGKVRDFHASCPSELGDLPRKGETVAYTWWRHTGDLDGMPVNLDHE